MVQNIVFSKYDESLTTQMFSDEQLVKKCVDDVKNKLFVKPYVCTIRGKECYSNRNVGFFSDFSIGYQYSGQFMPSQSLTENLYDLLLSINNLYSLDFNSILVNYYENGENDINFHSDNEHNFKPIGVVALSYGHPRTFKIKENDKTIFDIQTQHCQIDSYVKRIFKNILNMEFPKQLKIKKGSISFTFRKHLI